MRPKVYCGGTFDLPHHGHVNFLRACSRFGDVVVSLNTDAFAARYKRPPILTLREREAILNEFESVSYTVVNVGDEDSKPAILSVMPKFVAHGSDWEGGSLLRQMGLTNEWLAEHGIKLLYVPYTDRISSSDIIARCSQR